MAILAGGHVVEEGDLFGWIYQVDADQRTFSVSHDGDNQVSWPWPALPADKHFLTIAGQLGPNNE